MILTGSVELKLKASIDDADFMPLRWNAPQILEHQIAGDIEAASRPRSGVHEVISWGAL